MRLASRKVIPGLALTGLAGVSACLFSTNPPKPSSSGGDGNSDPNAVVVTGQVRFFDRTDHHTRNMPGWVVRADWYVRTGDGSRLAKRSIARSNPSGIYEVQFSNPYVVQVELRARVCTYNDKDADCCLEDPPCDHPICSEGWIAPVQLTVGPGSRERKTLTVPCDHAP